MNNRIKSYFRNIERKTLSMLPEASLMHKRGRSGNFSSGSYSMMFCNSSGSGIYSRWRGTPNNSSTAEDSLSRRRVQFADTSCINQDDIDHQWRKQQAGACARKTSRSLACRLTNVITAARLPGEARTRIHADTAVSRNTITPQLRERTLNSMLAHEHSQHGATEALQTNDEWVNHT